MFQKLKDKLAEEVKQSSLKFPVSVQQITQAVSSSSSPSKQINSEPIEGIKNKDIDNESSLDNENLNAEYDDSFTTIDLRSPTQNRNRRSSSSSDLFPIYEFLPNRHVMQSDLESNSEFDDGSSIHQSTNVSKEILYEKYRNMLQKYHKYRGRFADMRKYYLELEREHEKIKNVLTETQDKAIRRTKELKEQCTLEQTAKAHLEDVLRNELEERDLIISTLNTKIKLLKCGRDGTFIDEPAKSVRDPSKNQSGSDQLHLNSFQEIELLKDKIKTFELLLSKAKDAITTKNDQIKTLEGRIEANENELKRSNAFIVQLQDKIDLMKHKEEEALLSLAENKMVVHKELEAKEKHIKILESKITHYVNQKKKLRNGREKTDLNFNSENVNLSEEIQKRDEIIENLGKELHQFKKSDFSDLTEKSLVELNQLNSQPEFDSSEINDQLAKISKYEREIEKLKLLISDKKKEFDELRTDKENEIDHLMLVKASQESDISNLKAEISSMKDQLLEKIKICQENSALNDSLNQMRESLSDRDKQTISHLEIINKLQSELSIANNKLIDSGKYQKMYEEVFNNSKADKIIAEELMKNVKNELTISQTELKNAKNELEKCQAELRSKGNIIEEKCILEKRFLEHEKNMKEAILSLEQAKRVEQEMHVQIANFIEEINELKFKESNYLNDIRKLKEDLSESRKLDDEVKRLNTLLEESNQKSEKLFIENETIGKENKCFKEKVEDLKDCICNLEESLLVKKKFLEKHYSPETFNQKLFCLTEDLNRCREENTKLSLKNQQLLKNNEDVVEKFEMLFAKNKSLQTEIDLLKQSKLTTSSQIEMLKNLCKLSEHYSDESEILNNALEKLSQLLEDNANIRKENEVLKFEVNKLENCDEENKILALEKEKLEWKLSDECNKFNELLLKHNQIQCDLEISRRLNDESEQTVCNLREKLDRFAKTLQLLGYNEETLLDVNQTIPEREQSVDLSNLSRDSVATTDSVPVIPATSILRIRSQLSDFKVNYEKVQREFSHFREFFTNQSAPDEICLPRLEKLFQNCVSKNELIRDELLSLRKEKEDLILQIRTLEKEMEDVKKQSEESFCQRELFLKEKFEQEVKEIVNGYEKRLAEKENEYEVLQNKMNLRTDRENVAMYEETKEIIQNLQEELTAKQDSYADLLITHKNVVKEFNEKCSELKENSAKELRENDKKWRSCLDKRIEEVDEKYKEEINELTKEWAIDRKSSCAPTDKSAKESNEFLEDGARQTEDSDALKKHVEILTSELSNCKRSHWREIDLNMMNSSYDGVHHSTTVSLEDYTEMEYLRNILFKYMMGHQPMVLAKVLAAVVKFDNNQTEQVLLREEQKQSLIGHLGFT